MIQWCVAHTQSLKETLAQQHLRDQGFDVYLPRFKKLRRHARKTDEVLVPLFPRYIFVGIDPEISPWRKINGTRGISYLLMASDNCPALVSTSVIGDLRAQEVSDGILPVSSLVSFLKGDKVRILEGSLKDQTVVFEKLDDKGRVQLLLNLLGKDVKFSLSSYAIEAA
ncbi:MAG: transcriptional activator RfaH [Alphaproteobacteria bacterium 16-39-46]|nr:MAG: transcriptional activator RfaH [Alphaproteobacteria bacterium 16-39-46]OZA44522.1 MAG: transcriptional activator RfaH [Alphaproteobacteria bacterium 17-39-52]HQS83369.1 transcription termination/antitermination NusG family protein [Alphaproteobacteria bacterium]HQS93056.1 transcription termination/antitermination NusG family protein [Alphaproteobacteria bacterium]